VVGDLDPEVGSGVGSAVVGSTVASKTAVLISSGAAGVGSAVGGAISVGSAVVGSSAVSTITVTISSGRRSADGARLGTVGSSFVSCTCVGFLACGSGVASCGDGAKVGSACGEPDCCVGLSAVGAKGAKEGVGEEAGGGGRRWCRRSNGRCRHVLDPFRIKIVLEPPIVGSFPDGKVPARYCSGLVPELFLGAAPLPKPKVESFIATIVFSRVVVNWNAVEKQPDPPSRARHCKSVFVAPHHPSLLRARGVEFRHQYRKKASRG
jgi:hypothetical protein